jgi:hypothetical protein
MLIGVTIVGLMFIIFDPFSYRHDMVNKHGYHKNAFAVDFMLILSNFPAMAYFSFNKMLMKERIIPHIFFVNLIMMVIFIIMAVLYDDAQLNFSESFGIFGWMHPTIMFKTVFLYGFIATFWG